MIRCCIGILVALTCTALVHADPPAGSLRFPWLGGWHTAKCCPSPACCVDDYLRKPCPLVAPMPRCGGPDDYCRKPVPCVLALPRCGSPDDYCRKALPCLLCPPLSPYLQCGSTGIDGCSKITPSR